MQKTKILGILATIVVAMSSALCNGSIVITAQEHWDTTPLLDSWSAVQGPIGGSGVNLANSGNFLQISLAGNISTPTPADAIVYTSGSPFTTGLQNGDVSFSFMSLSASPPSELAVYFHSANGDSWVDYLYQFPVGTAPNVPLQAYVVSSSSLVDGANWTDLGNANAASFATDFASIDRFGFYIAADGGQNFGLDDVVMSYSVPEPETVWLLVAAFASLGITYRSKISAIGRGLVKRS